MTGVYQLVVGLTVSAHLAFLAYLAAGGFIALRWRRSLWLHIAAVLWGVVITAAHLDCPLTGLERWARAGAGMQPLPSEGFIAHYIVGVIYPAGWSTAVQAAVWVSVAVSWALYARQRREPAQCGNA